MGSGVIAKLDRQSGGFSTQELHLEVESEHYIPSDAGGKRPSSQGKNRGSTSQPG